VAAGWGSDAAVVRARGVVDAMGVVRLLGKQQPDK